MVASAHPDTPHVTAKPAVADTVLDLIGATPMVRLQRVVEPGMATILAKLEMFNPGGSVKDRICLSMVRDAERQGRLAPGGTIVEPTSGNTGIGLAMIGAVRRYRVILTMPETMTEERVIVLRRLGAEIELTPGPEGMRGAVRRAEAIVAKIPGAFMPQQFLNPANPEAHRQTTVEEILEATGGRFDAFVAGVGTGGTVTGVGSVLKHRHPQIRIIAVEPATSPVLSGGAPGPHRIQGIGAGFVPAVLDRGVIDEILVVEDEEAYAMATRLAREEGLFVGLSSGAAVWAARAVARQLGAGRTVVTVLPDTGDRYLSIEEYF